MLNGQEFIQRFNTSRHHAPTWNYLHVQMGGGPGALFGYRLSDLTCRYTNLQRLISTGVVVDGDVFSFICSQSDYFLFSRNRAGQMPVLIVVNIRTMYFLVIDCPPEIHQFDFISRREDIKLNVFVVGDDVEYEIVACILDRNVMQPVMCVYSSMLEEWLFTERARLLARNEDMDFQDDRSMFFVSRPYGNAFSISVRDWLPVCREEPLFQALFNNVIFVPRALAAPYPGWERRLTRHYSRGTQGWAATMFFHIDLEDQRSIVIRDVRLYHITPDWGRYELRAVLDAHHLNPPQVLVPYRVTGTTLESTNEFVQLGMVVYAGPNRFRLKLFIFNLASGQWTHIYTNPFAAFRVGGPALTSGLRLTL